MFNPIQIRPGDTISVVGPTGSGKSAFINDIEMFAAGDTITGRTILVNGEEPPADFIRDPAKKPVAMITQNNRCLCDLSVYEFLQMHAKSRKEEIQGLAEETIDLANQFTGEPIFRQYRMTQLSGGQTRALMIADAIHISDTPIILLDEIENAGIFKERVIDMLRHHNKALLFVTHDPLVSLLSSRRIVLQGGAVVKVLTPQGSEHEAIAQISSCNLIISQIREQIRNGNLITSPSRA